MKRRLLILALILCIIPTQLWAGQIKLTWNAPTTNSDGTPISYFEGDYRVFFGPATRDYTMELPVKNTAAVVVQTIPDIADGIYYIAVKAVNTLGNSSAYSNEIIREIVTVGTNPVPSKPTGFKAIK